MKVFFDFISSYKIIFSLILLLFLSSSMARLSQDVEILFDRTTYHLGETAWIKVITKKRPTNPDYEFVVSGSQVIDNVSSEIVFQRRNNIFSGATGSLSHNSLISINVKFQNTKRIKEIDARLSVENKTLEFLLLEYNRTHDEILFARILNLKKLIAILEKEKSDKVVIVQKVQKTIQVTDTNPPDPENEDEGQFSLIKPSLIGINYETLNPTSLNLKLNAGVEGNFNLNPSSISFKLNGYSIDAKDIIVSSKEILFSLNAEEGRNVLTVEGLDSLNLPFKYETEFTSGSKRLNLNIQGVNEGILNIFMPDFSEFKVSRNFTGQNVEIENVPDLPIIIDVIGENRFGFSKIEKGESSTVVVVDQNELPSSIVNNDFNNGTNGWNIISGDFLIKQRVIDGQEVPGNLDMVLSAENSNILVKRTFFANVQNQFLALKFDIQTSRNNDEIHVILRNLSSGEVQHNVYYGRDFIDGPSKSFDISRSISVKATQPADVISLEIRASRMISEDNKNRNREDEVFLIELDRFIELSSSLKFYAHNLKGPQPVNGLDVFTAELKTLSIGQIPSSVDIDYKIPFNFELQGGNSEISKIDLIIEQIGTNKSTISSWLPTGNEARITANRNNLQNNYSNRYIASAFETISFDKDEIEKFDNFDHPLSLYMAVHFRNGEVQYAHLGRSIAPLEFRQDSSISYFSGRDWDVGGDTWAQKFVWDILMKFFNFEDNLNFKINDLSRLNGGHFNPHYEHTDGTSLDFRFDGYYSLTGTTERLDQHAISKTLKLVSDVIVDDEHRALSYIDSILISFNTATRDNVSGVEVQENSMTNLKFEHRAGCTLDNRTVRSIVSHSAGHLNHGHFRFIKTPISPVRVEVFPKFRPFFKRIEPDPYMFEFEAVSTEFNGTEQFIWDIRKVSDNSIVDVIDKDTVEGFLNSGVLLKASANKSSFSFKFAENPNKYKITLVVAKGIVEFGDTIRWNERCLSQSFELNVDPENKVGCLNEWQTFRGRDQVDPISKHVSLKGALVSKDTDFRAGRFFVENDTSAICGRSEILDSYSSTAGCSFEDRYNCASIFLKGIVGIKDSKIDSSNGRILIAGTSERFVGKDPIEPSDLSNGVGQEDPETYIYSSNVIANSSSPIIIINSDIDGIDGRTVVTDSALIQQSNVWWATVKDASEIKGATISGFRGADDYEPQISISGNSEILGFVTTSTRLDINNATIDKQARAFGTGLISNSLLRGNFSGLNIEPGQFNSTRIAKLVDSTVFYGGWINDLGQVLNNAVVGEESAPLGIYSVVADRSTVRNGALLFGDSTLYGNTNISGPKANAYVLTARNTQIDSSVGGTGLKMDLYDLITNEGNILGTPTMTSSQINGGSVSDNSIVTGQSFVSESASISGNARLSNISTIKGSANLSGTVHVSNGCVLSTGSFSSGIITPGQNSPCEAKKLNFLLQYKNFAKNYKMRIDNRIKEETSKRVENQKSKRAQANLLRFMRSEMKKIGSETHKKIYSKSQASEIGRSSRDLFVKWKKSKGL